MKKSIKELKHLWRYNAKRDYIEIDGNDKLFKPSLTVDNKTTFCKVLRYKNGTPYVRFNNDSWIIDGEETYAGQ